MKERITYTISEFAEAIGVAPITLRRWDAEGRLSPQYHTRGGHRRYTHDQLLMILGDDKFEKEPKVVEESSKENDSEEEEEQ